MPATELRERNEWFRSEYNSRRRDPEELRGAGDSGRIVPRRYTLPIQKGYSSTVKSMRPCTRHTHSNYNHDLMFVLGRLEGNMSNRRVK